jgi:hypothetical protein
MAKDSRIQFSDLSISFSSLWLATTWPMGRRTSPRSTDVVADW